VNIIYIRGQWSAKAESEAQEEMLVVGFSLSGLEGLLAVVGLEVSSLKLKAF